MTHKNKNGRRMIYCPGPEKWLTLRQYLDAYYLAKANPKMQFKQTFTCWYGGTGKDAVREFVEGMMDRINQGIPYCERGLT